jgi:hypothetical protein
VDWLTRLEAPADALAVLTAMITPAVLISACGALIFSTATRMGRVIDRVRFLSARFEELARGLRRLVQNSRGLHSQTRWI